MPNCITVIQNSLSNYYIISLGHYCIVLVRHEDGDHQSRIVLAFLSMQSRVISAGITQKKWMCLRNVFMCARARVFVWMCVYVCSCVCVCVHVWETNYLKKCLLICLPSLLSSLKSWKIETLHLLFWYTQCHD